MSLLSTIGSSTLIKNALTLHHSDQVHREEPKSYTKLKALVADIVEDQQQEAFIDQQKERSRKDRASPIVPPTQVDGKK